MWQGDPVLPAFRLAYSKRTEQFPWANPHSQRKNPWFLFFILTYFSLSSVLSAVSPAKINGASLNSNFCMFRLSPVSPACFSHISYSIKITMRGPYCFNLISKITPEFQQICWLLCLKEFTSPCGSLSLWGLTFVAFKLWPEDKCSGQNQLLTQLKSCHDLFVSVQIWQVC